MARIIYTVVRKESQSSYSGFFVRGLRSFVLNEEGWPKIAEAPDNTAFTIFYFYKRFSEFGGDRQFFICRAASGLSSSVRDCRGEFEVIVEARRPVYARRLMEWWNAGDGSYEYALHCREHLKPRITKLPPFRFPQQPGEPGESDAVLGGSVAVPPGAAVLGGIEGVRMRLHCSAESVQLAAAAAALQYGSTGVELLQAAAKDSDLPPTVREAIAKLLSEAFH